MRRYLISLLCCCVCGCATSNALTHHATRATAKTVRAESDELKDLQDAAHARPAEDAPRPRKPERPARVYSGNSRCGDNNDDDSQTFSGQLAGMIIAAPFQLTIGALGDDYDHETLFPDFPYADGAAGSLFKDHFEGRKTQSWTGTLQAFAIRQAHDVDRFGGRLLLDSSSRFGIDTETNYWTQGLLKGPSDQLWTGDANIVFRFAESEKVQWRAGAGMNWLIDNVRTETGLNLTYGVEWFPAKPWTVSSVIDVGTLGDAGLFHNRTTLGAMLGSTELFVGYDYFQLGSTRFQGPVAGAGWRF